MGFKNLSGERFGRLVVTKFVGRSRHKKIIFECVCDCGKSVAVIGDSLKRGLTKSCGCLQREATRTHGRSKSSIYCAWINMRSRCENPKCPEFKNYGARGIKVCRRWAVFENFLADMGERPSPTHSLERIKNNEGYRKSNCKWATKKEQSNNKRDNRWITFRGERLKITEWCKKLGGKSTLITIRLQRGWTLERALTTRSKKEFKHGQ